MHARTASPLTIPVADGPVAVWLDRTVAGTIAAFAATLTALLLRVTPDARGHGTHEQLGLAPCGWPAQYGAPCPTCGCTTAACQLVHGDVFGGFATQPFGAAVALVGLLAGAHAFLCLVRGRSFVDALVRVPFWRVVAGGFVLLLLAWGYKWLVWPG